MIEFIYQFLIDHLGKELALIVGSLVLAIGYAAARYVWRQVRVFLCFVRSRHRALGAVGREFHKDGPREGSGVWVAEPIVQPDDYERDFAGTKVLAIANLKGGVGKTTLAANIGAFFSNNPKWNKRVLLIDLDFQGSLSSMALPEDERWLPARGQDSLATRMISGDLESALLVSCAKSTLHEPKLKIITAHYDLAQADNRLLIEWLLRCRQRSPRSVRMALGDLLYGKLFKSHDVRYNLAEVLHSNAVRTAFDLVIIDCPPRLTTSAVQALCASSHLLIPTILDTPSAEAALKFCEQIQTLKSAKVCPHVKVLGIVGTKYKGGQLAEKKAEQRLRDGLRANGMQFGLLPQEQYFPQTAAVVRDASEGIAYFVMGNTPPAPDAKAAIEKLSTFVAGLMGLPTYHDFAAGDLTEQEQRK